MRLFLNIMSVLMLGAIVTIAMSMQNQDEQVNEDVQLAHRSLLDLKKTLDYHAALGQAESSDHGYPLFVMPEWFGDGELPVNPLAEKDQPWIDLAPPGDESLQPPDPILYTPQQAGIWYNPNNGVFRARVPARLTDREALELYNRVNGCELSELRNRPDSERQPLAYSPERVTDLAHNVVTSSNEAYEVLEEVMRPEPVVEQAPEIEAEPAPRRPTLRGLQADG